MSFEDHIKDFNLELETNLNVPSVDFSKFECTLSKSIVYLNKAITDTMQLAENAYLEVHTSLQSGALVIGMRSSVTDNKHTLKPKLLKTKPSKIAIAPLLNNYSLSTTVEHKIDLIDVGEGYIVFAIITPVAVGVGGTGHVTGSQEGEGVEEIPEWSDF